jgi:uncharacterized protein YuzE
MTVNYDPRTDTLTVRFSREKVEESDEGKPGVILDYDARGRLVGIEILDASKNVENPAHVDYSVAV